MRHLWHIKSTFILTLVLGVCLIFAGCSGSSGPQSSATQTPQAPQIAAQPADKAGFLGDTATFSVTATGSAPLTYDWRRNGATLGAASAAAYTTPSLTALDDATSYSVVVTNAAGSVTSATAKLSVSPKPIQVTLAPQNVSVAEGKDASFTVSATGSVPITYQWLQNGAAIAGANQSSYTLSAARLTDSGKTFSVTVSNTTGAITTPAATLTVTPAMVSIMTQPTSVTRFVGETAAFTVVANDSSPTLQWRRNGAAIPGATGSTYTTPALVAADDKTSIDVVVSNDASSVVSTAALLSVGPFAYTYTSQKGVAMLLYAWPGAKTALLTASATLDPVVVRNYLNALDRTYAYYARAVGKEPFLITNYKGLGTVAEIPSSANASCGGAACTYLGGTGMEIAQPYFNWMFFSIPNKAYDQIPFYEMGRSFWLFPQLTFFNGYNDSCLNTGFAVLMRFRSMAALGYQGSFNSFASSAGDTAGNAVGISNYNQLVAKTAGMIDTYAADNTLSYENTFLPDKYTNPNGSCADLFASMIRRLAAGYGDEAFIQSLWKEVLKRPAATSNQDAADNFILAASAAANHNLTALFRDTWRWPISVSATNEATSRFGAP